LFDDLQKKKDDYEQKYLQDVFSIRRTMYSKWQDKLSNKMETTTVNVGKREAKHVLFTDHLGYFT